MEISLASSVLLLLLFILTVLYHSNKRVEFYVRFVTYSVLGFWACIVASSISLLRSRDPGNAMIFSWLCRNIVAKVLNIKCEIKNKERLLVNKSCVVVGNHQSAVDVLAMMFLWPYLNPAVPVVKKELAYTGPAGLLGYLAKAVFLDRDKSEKARDLLNAKIEEVKTKKWKIWVFPEGTRNANRETMLPFKKGAFHIAVKAQLPVLPIVFAPYNHIYDMRNKVFKSGTIVTYVLPPVSTEGMTTEDVPSLMETVRASMIQCFEDHCKQHGLKYANSEHPKTNLLSNGLISPSNEDDKKKVEDNKAFVRASLEVSGS